MPESLTPLIADFLEWLAREPRTYGDVMNAWRTSCPDLIVWEDAVDGGLITRVYTAGSATKIELTELGWLFLSAQRPYSTVGRPSFSQEENSL